MKTKDRRSIRWLVFISLLFSGYSSAWAVDRSNWMWEMYHDRGDTRIRDMVIPATHDSATYSINSSSDVAPDVESPLKFVYSVARSVAAKWSKTQTRDIYTQLNDGIRYLDLRVKKHNGQLVIVHGLVGPTLEEVLIHIRDWAQEHPKEVVIVDFAKNPNTDAELNEMDALVSQYLGHLALPSDYASASLMLQDAWNAQRNLVLLNDKPLLAARNHWWDTNAHMHGVYGDTTNPSVIYNSALNGRGSRLGLNNQDLNRWHNISLTTTPAEEAIIKGTLSSISFAGIFGFFNGGKVPESLSDMTIRKIRYTAPEWVPDFIRQGKKVNVVSVDFYEVMSVVDVAIAMNWKDVPAPGGQIVLKETNQYDYVWHDVGSGADEDSSIWRPKSTLGSDYKALGHVAHRAHHNPTNINTFMVNASTSPANSVVPPVGYGWVWHDWGSDADVDGGTWAPIAPKGYTCLGHVGAGWQAPPSIDEVRCVHDSYLSSARHNDRIWNDHNSSGDVDAGWWAVHPWNMTGDRWSHLFLSNRNKWANDTFYQPKVIKDSGSTLDGGYQELRDGAWGKCLTVKHNQVAPDQDVIMHSCNGALGQKWKYEPLTGYLRSALDPGYCLGNYGQAYEGGNVNIFHCIDHNNVRWDWKGGVLVSRANPSLVVHPPCQEDYCSVIQYRAHGGANQNWSYTGDKGLNADGSVAFRQLKSKHHGSCLTIYHNKVANRQNVIMYQCNGGNNQLWKYDANTGYLHSGLNPNYCLHNAGDHRNHGAVDIHHCAGIDHINLKWDWDGDKLLSRGNKSFAMASTCGNNDCNVLQWPAANNGADTWAWGSDVGQEISLKNRENGRCIAVHGEVQNWAQVDMADCNSADQNQRWVDLGDGMLRSSANSTMCVDIAHGQLVDMAQLVMWPCHGQANQQWRYNSMTGHITTLLNHNWAIKGHAGQDSIMRAIEPDFVDQTWNIIKH